MFVSWLGTDAPAISITQPPSQTDEAQGAILMSWVKSGWGSRHWLVVLCFGSVVAPMPTSLAHPVSLAPTHSIAHHGRLSSLECHSSHPAGFLPGLDHFSHFTPPHTSADCHLPAAADLTSLFTPANLRRQSEYLYCIVFACAWLPPSDEKLKSEFAHFHLEIADVSTPAHLSHKVPPFSCDQHRQHQTIIQTPTTAFHDNREFHRIPKTTEPPATRQAFLLPRLLDTPIFHRLVLPILSPASTRHRIDPRRPRRVPLLRPKATKRAVMVVKRASLSREAHQSTFSLDPDPLPSTSHCPASPKASRR